MGRLTGLRRGPTSEGLALGLDADSLHLAYGATGLPLTGTVVQRWNKWYRQSYRSGIQVLKPFAERLKGYVGGIISSATHGLNISVRHLDTGITAASS